MSLSLIWACAAAYGGTVDFGALPIFQACETIIFDWFCSPDLTTSHPTFEELEPPSPPAHNSFTESSQTGDLLTIMSNQDIFPTLSASPYVDFARLATTSPHHVPLASDPMIGSTHVPANRNSDWALQHLDTATAFAQNLDTHQPPELERAVIPRVPHSPLRTSGAL